MEISEGKMPTGREMQLTKQTGEYLVAAELCRRGMVAATFTGNVPDYDIIASDKFGNVRHVQVKAIRSGGWQLSIDRFTEVSMVGDRQVMGATRSSPVPGLMFVFVKLQDTGKDLFFIIGWEELTGILTAEYSAYLKKHGGIRPRNPQTKHCGLSLESLKPFENQWETLSEEQGPYSGNGLHLSSKAESERISGPIRSRS